MFDKRLLKERRVPQRQAHAVSKASVLKRSIARLAKLTKTDADRLYAAVSRNSADKVARRRASAHPEVTSVVNRVCRRLKARSIDDAVRRVAEDVVNEGAGDVELGVDDVLNKAAARVADEVDCVCTDPEVKARVVAEAVSFSARRAVVSALKTAVAKARQAAVVKSAKARFTARRAGLRALRRAAANTYAFQTPFSLTANVRGYTGYEEFDDWEENVKFDYYDHADEVIGYFEEAYAEDKATLTKALNDQVVEGVEFGDAVMDENGFVTWNLTADRELAQDELDGIADFIEGQCSDGFGEGLEQQVAAEFEDDVSCEVPDDEDDPDAGFHTDYVNATVSLYINLWSTRGWSIKQL